MYTGVASRGVSMDRVGYHAGYLRFFRIRIGFGYSFLKKIGSGYWFDFYNEIFLRVIQDVTNDGVSVFFAMVFILSVCAALQRWDQIWSAGVDSCRILRFSFGPGSGPRVKNL